MRTTNPARTSHSVHQRSAALKMGAQPALPGNPRRALALCATVTAAALVLVGCSSAGEDSAATTTVTVTESAANGSTSVAAEESPAATSSKKSIFPWKRGEDSGTVTETVTVPPPPAQLPWGGDTIFPDVRMVALYGHPSGPALGALGAQSPEEAVARVEELAQQYQPFSEQKVVPAFEVIGTVASGSPGPDGDYSNEWDAEDLLPYIDAITQAGGYAVIDLQPGAARFIDQVKRYEELLRRPGVGLALDPEWKLQPGQQPLHQIGQTDAAEVNEVIDWYADLARDANGPQKMLILHQFQLRMYQDRELIDLSHPELQVILHADGNGTPEMKMETYNVLHQDLDPRVWSAWKNFYTEDSPTFTPEETMNVEPQPWFVSYQ